MTVYNPDLLGHEQTSEYEHLRGSNCLFPQSITYWLISSGFSSSQGSCTFPVSDNRPFILFSWHWWVCAHQQGVLCFQISRPHTDVGIAAVWCKQHHTWRTNMSQQSITQTLQLVQHHLHPHQHHPPPHHHHQTDPLWAPTMSQTISACIELCAHLHQCVTFISPPTHTHTHTHTERDTHTHTHTLQTRCGVQHYLHWAASVCSCTFTHYVRKQRDIHPRRRRRQQGWCEGGRGPGSPGAPGCGLLEGVPDRDYSWLSPSHTECAEVYNVGGREGGCSWCADTEADTPELWHPALRGADGNLPRAVGAHWLGRKSLPPPLCLQSSAPLTSALLFFSPTRKSGRAVRLLSANPGCCPRRKTPHHVSVRWRKTQLPEQRGYLPGFSAPLSESSPRLCSLLPSPRPPPSAPLPLSTRRAVRALAPRVHVGPRVGASRQRFNKRRRVSEEEGGAEEESECPLSVHCLSTVCPLSVHCLF